MRGIRVAVIPPVDRYAVVACAEDEEVVWDIGGCATAVVEGSEWCAEGGDGVRGRLGVGFGGVPGIDGTYHSWIRILNLFRFTRAGREANIPFQAAEAICPLPI